MSRSRYIVGIDLGTTNCAVAYVDTRGRERPSADIKPFDVPQLVAAGETAPRAMLPSFLYLPGEHDLPAGAARLPWREESDQIVGEFARIQGARVPGRLVASAKSWLCHAGVDREADILPWGAASGVRKVSPVEASADYLRHIRDAWNHVFRAAEDPARRLEDQEVVLTVPASFDEAARELTVEAAKRAGLNTLTLLEEPQAAFYCWIVTHQSGWQKQVRAGELILVCDIGGGTSDFSLITVVETPTGPGFRRVAVGDHLMLGGDNIDLALAHRVESRLGARLDSEQWSALRYACRTAKEKLLSDAPVERWPVTIAGRGSKLIGGGLQSELTLAEVRDAVIDGFFPRVERGDEPSKTSKVGLQEFGLPYVADASITRHLAAFLRRHRAEAVGQGGHVDDHRPARPDAILFNGGALTPSIVRDRVVDVLASWFRDDPGPAYEPRVLTNPSLDLAVAVGAAYYGVVRRGGGIRIGGGTARSFYVGFQAESPAAAGRPWLCVVPRDAHEGDEIDIDGRDFELLMGRPVQFPLASSSVRGDDRPGDLIADDPDSLRPSPPLQGLMRVGRKARAERVPVRLAARVSEVGTIELWCRSRTDERRWRLQIQLREAAHESRGASGATSRDGAGGSDRDVIEQSIVDAACAAMAAAWDAPADSEHGPTRVVKRLEEILETPRESWPPSALRALWEPLKAVGEARSQSPRHESRWYNLAGFCLRPGTGWPLDETRLKALWPTFHQGVKHLKDVQCWTEWWILWRRVAAGLSRVHHEEIHRRLNPYLLPPKGGAGKKPARPKPEPHELAEMWRCAASLERLSSGVKESLGAVLVAELQRPNAGAHALWCLGRLGARVPLFGPANTVVARDVVEPWLEALLARGYAPGRETADAVFALGRLAAVAGDRARDLDDSLRERVVARLRELGADEATILPVRERRELESKQQGVALGDALPVGLRLINDPDATGS